jgi:hypothetical protein
MAMTDDPHFEPGRQEVRCDHGDGKGWGHPADPTPGRGWAHQCCGWVGHCPQGDPRNFDHLPHGAVGDWLIITEHETRFYLMGLGTDDARWWRVPGRPESSRTYSDDTYRLAALRALPDDEDTWGGEPVTVGMRMTIGQGFMSDLWHTSRVVSIRRVGPVEIIGELQDL